MALIHPSAIIDPKAEIAEDVEIGPYAVIGPNVVIGRKTQIGAHTVVEGHTSIGSENRIGHFASVGGAPQDMKYRGEPTKLVIGDRNLIREFTLYTLAPSKIKASPRLVMTIGSWLMFILPMIAWLVTTQSSPIMHKLLVTFMSVIGLFWEVCVACTSLCELVSIQ